MYFLRYFLFTFFFINELSNLPPVTEIVNSKGGMFNPKTRAFINKSHPSFIPKLYRLQTILFIF